MRKLIKQTVIFGAGLLTGAFLSQYAREREEEQQKKAESLNGMEL